MKAFITALFLMSMACCLRAERLEQKVASLPVFDSLASTRTPFDWLLTPERSVAGIYRTPDARGIVVANGMVWRTFRITPNLATTDYVNRMTGERMLRAVSAEGSVSINGTRYPLGGLQGQQERGYLLDDWIASLTPTEGSFRVEDFETRDMAPLLPWKRTRWARNTLDATGREVVFTLRGPEGMEGVTLKLHVGIYDQLPVIRRYFELVNESSDTLCVDSFELERLARLDERLKAHIVGQDEAVDAVCAAIRRSRVGLKVKRKPVSFIFVGGTGVGKTELVKRLAADMFDSPESLIRLDMSEFMEKFSVSRIIGSPPGYVGYDEAGQLTEKIRRKPYSVVLFDEIEKAHPDVMNILLQILDDGRITDAQGRTVNFENTIIIMTTNAGSGNKTGSVGFGGTLSDMSRERALKALNEFLRPEFINRVDEVVCFNQLTEENFRGIAALMLGEVRDVLREKDMELVWDESLVDYLVRKGYSVTYGARNLRRLIQKEIEDEVAARVIENRGEAIRTVRLSAQDDKVNVECEG